MVESKADQPRLLRLKEIESTIRDQSNEKNLYQSEAPAGYENLTFEEKNAGKYMCTFPYPYMNGYLHLGHAFSMSKCEFQVRFQKQLGKNVLFPFGFHCTGMPIQASANRLKREMGKGELKSNNSMNPTQYEILQKIGISEADIPAFQDPNHWLNFFPPQGQKDLKEFGLHSDFRRSFITTAENPYYDSFIRWQFHHLKENGKIKFGNRPTIFSELDGQPCADHDRSKGEGVAPQEYVGIKIQLLEFPESLNEWKDKQVFLVAATLRPETMYGQTNCFILPEGEYGLFEMKTGEFFVISERAARNMAFQNLTKEEKKYPRLATFKGSEFIGLKLKAPLTSYEHVYALPLPTISMNKGTGIVTSVPSDSPDDFAMLRDLQTKQGLREKINVKEEWVVPFEPIPIIEIPGMGNLCAKHAVETLKIQSHKDADKLKQAKEQCYNEGFYKGIMITGLGEGKKVEEAKPIVKAHMIENNLAFVYFEPESEVVSRTQDQCIVALCDQWLLNYGEDQWREEVKTYVASDDFECYNPRTKNEFMVILDWLKEWGCSRTKGLGTRLPWDDIFVIESLSDSTIYMAYYTIAHLLQGGVLNGSETGPLGVKAEDLNVAAFDYVFLGADFDQEKYPNITEEQLKKMRYEFEYWYPMDMRVSGKDLIRNHLTMSLYNHNAIWKNDPKRMTQSYYCNGFLMLNNQKMSKSTGNFMTLAESAKKFGVDSTRIALADSGDSLDDANFDEMVANAAILKLFVMEQWIEKNVPAEPVDFAARNTADYEAWDKIMINELNRIMKLVKTAYTEVKYKVVIKHAFNEMLSLKESYLIAKNNSPNPFVILDFIEAFIVMMNPIIPNFCQFAWQTRLAPYYKTCSNYSREITEELTGMGWPVVEEENHIISSTFGFLQDTKHQIRLDYDKAKSGGKKGKKKGKGAAPAEPEKPIDSIAVFVGMNFLTFQKKVLDIMQTFEFDSSNVIQGDYIKAIRECKEGITKKEMGFALKFAAFKAKEAETIGKAAALATESAFDEVDVINTNCPFLFENMPNIKNTKALKAEGDDAVNALPNQDAVKIAREAAVPGKPTAYFYAAA